jgi:hypothetical protein
MWLAGLLGMTSLGATGVCVADLPCSAGVEYCSNVALVQTIASGRGAWLRKDRAKGGALVMTPPGAQVVLARRGWAAVPALVHGLRHALAELGNDGWDADGRDSFARTRLIERTSRVLALVELLSESGHPAARRELAHVAEHLENPKWLRDWASARERGQPSCQSLMAGAKFGPWLVWALRQDLPAAATEYRPSNKYDAEEADDALRRVDALLPLLGESRDASAWEELEAIAESPAFRSDLRRAAAQNLTGDCSDFGLAVTSKGRERRQLPEGVEVWVLPCCPPAR